MAAVGAPGTDLRSRALDVLCSDDLSSMVEMVLSSPAPDHYEARAVDGCVRFTRVRTSTVAASRPGADGAGQAGDVGHADTSGPWHYRRTAVEGRDPLGRQDPAGLSPLAAELAQRQPDRRDNSYPLAFERIAQVFDHPCAPDLCVLHTAAHRPTAHRGEHGSLDVVQSRAPMVGWGAGVPSNGLVDGHCRTVDVAPTVLSLLGMAPGEGVGPSGRREHGLHLARQDGSVVPALREAGRVAEHVVVVLMDGANANVLYAAAADGTMPNLRTLVERGTALAQGAIASLPTVTLANHTSLNTGAHPGHHGVLHNAWYDRAAGCQVVTESPATWQASMRWLLPGVETVHEAVHRRRPDAVTVAVNESADRGADYSTMDLFRTGQLRQLLAGAPEQPPHADPHWTAASADYRWGSSADAAAVRQAVAVWDGEHLGVRYDVPAFTWISFSLTDAAFHEGGPHSAIARAALVDTDARLGEVLDAVDRRGVLDRTAVLVVADHGMEETGAEQGGDWGDALRAAGVPHRDEASGFLYLGAPGGDLGHLGAAPDPA